jgi:hypothetical protein
VTRPRRAAAKSGADVRFSGWTVSDDPHPAAASAMAATVTRNGVEFLTIALRLDGGAVV